MSKAKTVDLESSSSSTSVKRIARTARVEVRTFPDKKVFYHRAANLRGQSFTEFVESSLDEAAARIHKEYESIQLSQRDAKAFVKALLADDNPNAKLTAAARRYNDWTKS